MTSWFSKSWELIRPKQISKNLLILLPAIISGEIFEWHNQYSKYLHLLQILFAFTLASIITYIINDICDLNSDTLNSLRKFRPLARGYVSIKFAASFACLLLLLLIILLRELTSTAILLILIYLFINLLYSFSLKRVPYWEIVAVSSGYIIRVLVGNSLINKQPTLEFFFFILFFALGVVVSKRLSESMNEVKFYRSVLTEYTRDGLLIIFTICLTISTYSYAGFVLNLINESNSSFLLVLASASSFIILLLILFRFTTLTTKGLAYSPENLLFSDKFILVHSIILAFNLVLLGYSR